MNNFFINLDFFESKEIKMYYEAKKLDRQWGMNVSRNDKKYKVFVCELFAILTKKEIPSISGNKTFDGFTLIDDYINGFENGVEYFKEEFSVKSETLYINPELFVNNLHVNYYHRCPNKTTGWIYWVESYPTIINKTKIEEYGYYAGIKYALDELIDKHPIVFKNFKDCPDTKKQSDLEGDILEASKTKKYILDELESIDKNKGWEYAFKSKNDFYTFVDLLTNYFEYNSYLIPESVIELKRDCKTRFAKALSPIHKELSNENKKLKSDIEFYKIVKTLNHFNKLTDLEIYNAITR